MLQASTVLSNLPISPYSPMNLLVRNRTVRAAGSDDKYS